MTVKKTHFSNGNQQQGGQPEASSMGVGGRACGLTQDGLPLAWEVYSSVVNDKYVGGGGGGWYRSAAVARPRAAGK